MVPVRRPLVWITVTLSAFALFLPAPLRAATARKKQPDPFAEIDKAANQEVEPDYKTLEEKARELLPELLRTKGPIHEDTLKCRDYLATGLYVLARKAEARQERGTLLEAQRALLAERTRTLGADHSETLAARRQIADTLSAMGKQTEAGREYRECLAGRVRALGEAHPDVIAERREIAGRLWASGDFAGAEREHRAILAALDTLRASRGAEYYEACYMVARCLQVRHKLKEAHEFAQQAESGRAELLGLARRDAEAATALRVLLEKEQKGK